MANEPIGREVFNIPFGEIIRDVALGIAEAQFELDKSSMNVAELMSGQRVLREAATGEPILDANNAPQMIDSRVFFGHEFVEGGSGAEFTAIKGRLGRIESIEVPEGGGGSGYELTSTEVTISGGSQAAGGEPATARVAEVDGNGAIVRIEVVNPGSGYTRKPTVRIVDTRETPQGSNATATANLDALDKVIGFEMVDSGQGYLVTPEIRLTGGGGTGAEAIARVDEEGKIIRIDIVDQNHGSGYTSAPTVEVIGKSSLQPQKRSMIELGFTPNFYQFVDTVIEIKLAMRVNKTQRGNYQVSASTVDANYASSYNYALNMASTVKTKIVPIPPPLILEERIRDMMDQEKRVEEEKAT